MGTPQTIKIKTSASDYPLIVKDLMGSGSKGVKIIESPNDLDSNVNKILYLEKYIEGTHYLAYFVKNEICVGEKQPLVNEHAKVRLIEPEKDIEKALMIWQTKYNLLFGHLDMIREKGTNKLIVVDPGTFPEFTNWKADNNLVPKICKSILERYQERSNNR